MKFDITKFDTHKLLPMVNCNYEVHEFEYPIHDYIHDLDSIINGDIPPPNQELLLFYYSSKNGGSRVKKIQKSFIEVLKQCDASCTLADLMHKINPTEDELINTKLLKVFQKMQADNLITLSTKESADA